jgi:hypothetical protein
MEPTVRPSPVVASRRALLVFPMAALLNSFSMTALLLLFGVAGQSEIAADIGLVQGATLALFYAFSANARNLILADATGSTAARLLSTRLWLLFPLSAAAYLLSVGVGDAGAALAWVLILRRASEWLGEIGLARHEQKQQLTIPTQAIVAEGVSFLFCLLPLFLDWSLAACALPWALAPLLATRHARLSLRAGDGHFSIKTLLPHFGSTAIIGTSVYVFRISIVLLAGKVVAGDLFTAFAIGGLIPTIYGQALAPTLAHRFGSRGLPKWLLIIPLGMLLIAAGVGALAVAQPAWLAGLGRSPNFWLAVGISIAGGALMSVAAALRTRLIQQDGGENVFGPDLLANVLIATCVPFVFYVLGPKALAGLYGLSGCLSLAFLAGVGWQRKGASSTYLQPMLLGIGFLLLIPVFFQIKGGLFRDVAYVFDAAGSILKLPLPLSILTLFAGIALLGNYAGAARTLTTLFFTALLFVMTSLTITQGNNAYEGAKLILLAQFLLPMFGLVLGQMYGASTSAPTFERAALWVLMLVLPAQLLATWLQGYTLLHPKVFFFSIYQHLQYVPMIIVALLMLVSQSLWNLGSKYRVALGVLLPVALLYTVASLSWGALLGASVCLAGFAATHLRKIRISRRAMATLGLTAICAISYVVLSESGVLSRSLSNAEGPRANLQWRHKLAPYLERAETPAPAAGETRMTHWRFYASGVVESPRAFFLGHATPPDRVRHPSAHNYWLDALYNFGAISMLPLIILLLATIHWIWRQRREVVSHPMLLGTTMAALYLLLFENMLKVGMRQPYPGIITFFIWGLLIARLQPRTTNDEKNAAASA